MAFSTNVLLFVILLNHNCLAEQLHLSTWMKTNSDFFQNVYVFETRVGQSVEGCVKTCKAKNMCKYINYQIQGRTCFLIGVSNTVGAPVIVDIEDNIGSKRGYIFGKKQDWNPGEGAICEECNPLGACNTDEQQPGQFSICQDSGCVLPAAKERAVIRGNMFSIGDKIKYECEDGFTAMDNSNVTATCQPSGYWSASEITCIPAEALRTCFGGSCYLLVNITMDWYDAKEHCISLGGLLVYIKTEEEWDFLMTTPIKNLGVWLGGDDIDVERTFKWQDGTAVSSGFENWRYDQPNNIDDRFDRATVVDCMSKRPDKTWHDDDCYHQYKSVCKFP